MLQVDFKIQTPRDSESFIFTDTTGFVSDGNALGYGSPNVDIADIVETKLVVKFPNGAEHSLFSTYLPTQGDWVVPASHFSDQNKLSSEFYVEEKDCGCGEPSNQNLAWGSQIGLNWPVELLPVYRNDCQRFNVLSKYADGCYTIRYEVYAVTNVPYLMCDYLVQATICDGQRLFVKMDGSWRDVTSDSVNNNGNLTWSVNGSYSSVTDWQVRNSPTEVSSYGQVKAINCRMSEETADYSYPKLVSSREYVVPFFSQISKKLSDKAFAIAVEDNQKNFGSSVPSLEMFLLAKAKMDAITNNPGCGCDCIVDTIENISHILDDIKDFGEVC